MRAQNLRPGPNMPSGIDEVTNRDLLGFGAPPTHPATRPQEVHRPLAEAVGDRADGNFAEVSLRSAARLERGDIGSIGRAQRTDPSSSYVYTATLIRLSWRVVAAGERAS
jgi:hypothetical protein